MIFAFQYLNLKHYQIASIYFSVGELNTLLFNCLTRFNFNLIEEKNKKKTILRSFFFYFFLGSDFCFDNRNSLNDFCLFQSHHYNIIGLNKSYFTDFVLPVSVFVETDALYLNFEGISLLNRSSLVQTFGTLENFSIFKGFFYVIKSLQAETFYKKTIMRIFEIDKSIFFLNSRFCFFFQNSIYLRRTQSFFFNKKRKHFLILSKYNSHYKDNSILQASRIMTFCERSFINKFFNF